MPNSPWQCSQCGTVNEPSATSCRNCGRWPSLFELQDSAVGDADGEETVAPVASSREAPRPVLLPDEPDEVQPYQTEAYEPETVDRAGGAPPAPSRRAPSPGRRLVRLIIPLGVLLYFLISNYFSNH